MSTAFNECSRRSDISAIEISFAQNLAQPFCMSSVNGMNSIVQCSMRSSSSSYAHTLNTFTYQIFLCCSAHETHPYMHIQVLRCILCVCINSLNSGAQTHNVARESRTQFMILFLSSFHRSTRPIHCPVELAQSIRGI